MRFNKSSFIVIACVLLLAAATVMAGSQKQVGTTGASELLIPVGVSTAALSGADIAGAAGINAIYTNPAGAGVISSRAEAVLSYQNYLAGINITYLSAVTTLGTAGNVGIGIKTMNFGDIQETTWESPDGTGSVFSPSYMTLTMTYARKFTDRIQFGANLNVINEKIMATTANGIGVDLGLQYVNDVTGLKLGIVLANFGTSMKFTGADLEYRGQLPDTETGSTAGSFGIPASKFELPTQLKIGVGYGIDLGNTTDLELSGAYYHNNSFSDQYILGAELTVQEMIFLRGSYSIGFLEGEDEDKFVGMGEDYMYGPAFGGGLIIGGSGLKFRLDYTYRITEYFDDIQMFGFTFGF